MFVLANNRTAGSEVAGHGTYHSGISKWNAREYNQVLGLSSCNLPVTTVPDEFACRFAENLMGLIISSVP